MRVVCLCIRFGVIIFVCACRVVWPSSGLLCLLVWATNELLDELLVLDETVVVCLYLDAAQQLLALGIGQLLTQREQDVGQLCLQHGAILVLIIQFQALDEVLVGAALLLFLHLAVDRQELLEREQLLAPFLGASILLDDGISWPQIERSEEVAQVASVHLANAFEIVDVKMVLDACFVCLRWMVRGGFNLCRFIYTHDDLLLTFNVG